MRRTPVASHRVEHVHRRDHVLLEVPSGVVPPEADVGVGRQVDDGVGAVDDVGQRVRSIDEVDGEVFEARRSAASRGTRAAGAEVVDPPPRRRREQRVDEIRSDEAGGPVTTTLMRRYARGIRPARRFTDERRAEGGRYRRLAPAHQRERPAHEGRAGRRGRGIGLAPPAGYHSVTGTKAHAEVAHAARREPAARVPPAAIGRV